MKRFFSRVQRELPDTDKDRYDIAYERGRAQSRSGLLFGGLVLGAISGLIGMFVLDPVRGAQRRAAIAARTGSLGGRVTALARTVSDKAKDLPGKAKDAAAERGISKPAEATAEREPSFAAGAVPPGRVEAPTRLETVGSAGSSAATSTIAADDSTVTAAPEAAAQPAPSGVDAPADGALTGSAGIVATPDFDRPHPSDTDLGSDAPGANVPDPLTPEELEAYGPSGPVAGAATNSGGDDSA
jgi:hypothetical protein